jgi:GntR family transcriptional regulator/MocR family aminotransferase
MWDFTLRLERGSERRLFMQIAQAIVDDICRGRLRPGDRLPGTRSLARSLGVNRVTVLGAFDELTAEGWLTTHPARGTYVSTELPQASAAERSRRSGTTGMPEAVYSTPAGPMAATWLPPARGVLMLRSSYPDIRLLRIDPLLRAYRRVLSRSGGALLGYDDPAGHPRLRRAIAMMLRDRRAIAASTENILITRGSQMALALTSLALIRPGDTVAVEEPGYPHAWAAFRHSGGTLVPIAVDADGLDIAALASLAGRRPVKAVYVTPHHQLPTSATLAASRRMRLLELARAHRFAVIEDDYDHEFQFDGRPLTPLASSGPDVVIYVGTLSKVVAPGLRLGYVAAPAEIVEQLTAYRQSVDMQGDPAMEAALAELIDEGEIQRHIRRAKRIYHARRDLMAELLTQRLGSSLDFTVPAGGIGLWARAAPDIDVDLWSEKAYEHGVGFLTGRTFTMDGRPIPFVRLGFACLDEEELRHAINRMAASLADARQVLSPR